MSHINHNWGKSNLWLPRIIYNPVSLTELRDLIIKASTQHSKIRVAGSLHSLNNLCVTTDIQVHTDKLCQVLKIDKQNLRVKVQGGIKIFKLLEILASEGLTLPNQGYIIDQSIAGAIATATHGSGNTGTISSFVEEIELIDAKGKMHILSPNTNAHLFSAAIVNLGCLGIIYSLTLRCIPLMKLHLTKVQSTLSVTLENLQETLQNHDYFQFAIDPYSDKVLVWFYKKTIEAYQNRGLYKIKRLLVKSLAVWSFDILPPPNSLVPYAVKLWLAVSPLKSCIDDSYKILSPADEGHYIEEEIAVPIENFEKALTATRQIIDRWSEQNRRMVAIILIRFCDPDPYGYLSPAYGRKTAFISLITIAKKGYLDLFKEVEMALYKYQGRPHWGKVNFLTREIVVQLYGSNVDKFLEARQELDPEGIFSNTYIHDRFK